MKTESLLDKADANLGRRSFLRYAAAGMAGAGVLAAGACTKGDPYYDNLGKRQPYDIGPVGDFAILNYAYALEQLEAAFYTQVVANMYTGASADEIAMFKDIRDHEIAHREFFKLALGANAMESLTPDFGAVNFTSKASVVATAQAFEDLGVSAYNGAGYLIKSADYLLIAGKIVSVEARHAAYIRNLANPGSFADGTILDGFGMDKTNTIAGVLKIANGFLKTKISAREYGYTA
ncbi:ferritin-like domain-containing protein [Mucilaginibacter auburnensis]|uniref:Ferritin-like protein n=1 Tax=Mucilaginibacter auburnensis TaxID=1457233 RepID=A0A2H9VTT5_9SPHI|nr:ferritin-like domain-containing protein [Mucilaginibacter auburnensis]PJJ84236.1 ferritin-like protein [Mucilaginibacter auburnensis]